MAVFKRMLGLILASLLVASLASSCAANAPAYPSKPITFIVPFGAGTGPDLTSRYIAAEMEKDLGQKVMVENRAGGTGTTGLGEVAKAKPDGYTIGLASAPAITYLPAIQDTAYKSLDDFTPIAGIDVGNGAFVVKADSKYKTFKDVLDDAKQRPGKVSVAVVPGLKGIAHAQILGVGKSTGTQFNVVPYDATQAVAAVIGGTLDAASVNIGVALPQVQAGKLRALTLLAPAPMAQLPGVPLIREFGVDITESVFSCLVAPKGLPAEVAAKLAASAKKVLESKAFADFDTQMGSVPNYLAPADLTKLVKAETARLTQVANEAGWAQK